ncbi:hypothetical protein PC128_g25203 [Phytophthora cactorum]|nr:hypothetical protein PC128_g25203 [Phytophthora cactorum]
MARARFYALKTPEAYPIKTTKWGNFTYCEGGFPLSRAVQVVTAQGSTPECIGVNVGSWCWRQQHRITLEFRAGLSRPHGKAMHSSWALSHGAENEILYPWI